MPPVCYPSSISGMKISVSLPSEVVVYLDNYAGWHNIGSRSAVLQRAVELLRAEDLAAAYEVAFEEWEASGDAELWDSVVGDGLGATDPALSSVDAPR